MSEQPPPLPPLGAPLKPAAPTSAALAPRGTGAQYDAMADKIGLVPNLRKKDNLYQGICVLAFVVGGMTAGWFWDGAAIRELVGDTWPLRIIVGGLAGLVAGTLLSGLFLLVRGLLRKT